MLFIQEKKIKNKAKAFLLGDSIEKEVPDTYEFDYVSTKEDIIEKLEQFRPRIVYIGLSKAYDIVEMVRRIKELFPEVVIFTILPDYITDPQELLLKLEEAGVYKCYYADLILNTLIHDMYVALNME